MIKIELTQKEADIVLNIISRHRETQAMRYRAYSTPSPSKSHASKMEEKAADVFNECKEIDTIIQKIENSKKDNSAYSSFQISKGSI